MTLVPLGLCSIPLALACACWSTACIGQIAGVAQPQAVQVGQPAPDETFRLSDRERDAILDGSTAESAAAARGEFAPLGSASPGIHGEMGILIGSNGTRAAYGTAAIPLGDKAGAVVTFESSRFGGDRR